MRALTIKVVVVAVALTIQAEALAQRPASVRRVRPLLNIGAVSALQSYPHYAPHGYYGGHGASTFAGSYLRGLAAGAHAMGNYNRLTAEARLIHTDAYRREVLNHELAAQTYFAMRQANREARAAERGPRATPADLARFAAQAKPQRLSPSELDNTGDISWPLLLEADEFLAFRVELQNTFSQRAANGRIGLDDHVKVRRTAAVMLEVLKSHVGGVDPIDYMVARRFIESLAFEARQPLG